jgi:hypothetical protein
MIDASIESVERMALALRNDLTVRKWVPSSKVAFWDATCGLAARTLSTICVTIVPSFFNSLAGFCVA